MPPRLPLNSVTANGSCFPDKIVCCLFCSLWGGTCGSPFAQGRPDRFHGPLILHHPSTPNHRHTDPICSRCYAVVSQLQTHPSGFSSGIPRSGLCKLYICFVDWLLDSLNRTARGRLWGLEEGKECFFLFTVCGLSVSDCISQQCLFFTLAMVLIPITAVKSSLQFCPTSLCPLRDTSQLQPVSSPQESGSQVHRAPPWPPIQTPAAALPLLRGLSLSPVGPFLQALKF